MAARIHILKRRDYRNAHGLRMADLAQNRLFNPPSFFAHAAADPTKQHAKQPI